MNGMHDTLVLAWHMALAALLGAASGYRRGHPFHAAPFALFSLSAATHALVYGELGIASRALESAAGFYFWMLAPFCLFMNAQLSRSLRQTARLIAAIVLATGCGTLAGRGYPWIAILACCCAVLARALARLRKGKADRSNC